MNFTQEEIDELIAKELTGEATAEEKAWLDGWKSASAENLAYYEESLALFRHIDSYSDQVDVNVDAAWKKVDERLDSAEETKILPLFPRKSIFRVAAALFLLALLSVIFYSLFSGPEPVSISLMADNTIKEEKLPDGSKVVLNKNAQIEFVSNKKRREVKLKGEAFFEVVHNETQPFVINVDGIFIEDIGTAFNVKAMPNSDLVEVLVEEGEVHFYTAEAQGLSLQKGQSGFYNKLTKEFRLVDAVSNLNTISYKTKSFQFRATRLVDVIGQLKDVYGMEIQLENDSLADCQVSVSFENEQPEVIMEILAETLNLEVIKSANGYLLKGTSCQR
jgi:transmembrane sensor